MAKAAGMNKKRDLVTMVAHIQVCFPDILEQHHLQPACVCAYQFKQSQRLRVLFNATIVYISELSCFESN